MKKLLFTLLSLSLIVSCNKESDVLDYDDWRGTDTEHYISKEKAIASVQEIIDQYDMVYVSDYVVKANTPFVAFFNDSKSINYDAWVVMINTNPHSFSGRFWRYLYIDAYSGIVNKETMEWGFPSKGFESSILKYGFGDSVDMTKSISEPQSGLCSFSAPEDSCNSWAVIISGGGIPQTNRECFWNDCSAIYTCLRYCYGYKRERIFVIMSDGTSPEPDMLDVSGKVVSSKLDLDKDGVDDVKYAATKRNISNVFDILKSRVSLDEQVSVFVTDHGGLKNGKSFICLWNNSEWYPEEFANEIKKLPSSVRKQVVMGQCFSGGFINELSNCGNISIATAAKADESAYTLDGLRSEFLSHWTNAAAGNVPSADCNGYSGLSMEELFSYAKKADRCQYEHPQYKSTPENVGGGYGYSGEFLGYPEFVIPNHISTSKAGGYTFEVTGVPEHCSVNWTFNRANTVNCSSLTSSSINVINTCGEAVTQNNVTVQVTTSGGWKYSSEKYIYQWRPGVVNTNSLIQGNLEDGKGTFSLPFSIPGANNDSDYVWRLYEDYYYPERNLFDNCEIYANNYFIDFDWTEDYVPTDYYVSVSFNNPLGEPTTIVRHFQ